MSWGIWSSCSPLEAATRVAMARNTTTPPIPFSPPILPVHLQALARSAPAWMAWDTLLTLMSQRWTMLHKISRLSVVGRPAASLQREVWGVTWASCRVHHPSHPMLLLSLESNTKQCVCKLLLEIQIQRQFHRQRHRERQIQIASQTQSMPSTSCRQRLTIIFVSLFCLFFVCLCACLCVCLYDCLFICFKS